MPAPSTRGPALRVVVAVAALRVPAWIAELVGDLDVDSRFEVVVSPVEVEERAPQDGRALRLYERLDAALFTPERDALAWMTLPGRLARPLASTGSCDVLVALASVDAVRDAPPARLGVWEPRWCGRREPVLLAESVRGELIETCVEAVLEDGERRSLYRSYGAPEDASLRRARSRALWKAGGAIRQLLVAASADPERFLESRLPVGDCSSPAPDVRPHRVVAFGASALRAVAGRRVRRALYDEPWFIGVRRRDGREAGRLADGPPFVLVDPPAGRSFADPFVLDDGGQVYVFFEDLDAAVGRAHISYLALDRQGRPTGERGRALETGHHLSYPFVFRRDGEIFMIPESSADRTISLYRAVDFPTKWTLERVLMEGLIAVDATLLEHDGRLWLFAAVFAEGASPNDDLYLFSAPGLGAEWEPHPANPVVADVRSARPAGPIFRSDGKLIRPAQDCSRVYGGAIVLNRIDLLTPEAYRETQIAVITPTWDARLEATHTYAFGDSIEVVDGRRLVRRTLRQRAPRLFGRRHRDADER